MGGERGGVCDLKVVNVLKPSRISELVEKETEEYHKADPDPFDDRHPGMSMKPKPRWWRGDLLDRVCDVSLSATRES